MNQLEKVFALIYLKKGKEVFLQKESLMEALSDFSDKTTINTDDFKNIEAIFDLGLAQRLIEATDEKQIEIFERCHRFLVENSMFNDFEAAIVLSAYVWVLDYSKEEIESYLKLKGWPISNLYTESGIRDTKAIPDLEEFFRGVSYILNDRDEEGIQILESLADAGDSESMRVLGFEYESFSDNKTAFDWYKKAAEAGSIIALENLGELHEELDNFGMAEEWFLRAAKAKQTNAYENLGWLYDKKFHDFERAIKWYQKAADIGDVYGMNNLGVGYRKYHNDYLKAEELYKRAAKAGYKLATRNLAKLYFYTLNEKDKAKKCLYKLVKMGDTEAISLLGSFYKEEGDFSHAIKTYRKLIKSGDSEAMCSLGKLYYRNLGEYDTARKWFLKAAAMGNANAMEELGYLYKNAFEDYKRAEKCFIKAIKAGSTSAMDSLAHLYIHQFNDYSKAFKWAQRAAKEGISKSMNLLGFLYRYKEGDLENAKKWFLKAAELGEAYAMSNLGDIYFDFDKDPDKAIEWSLKSVEFDEEREYSLYNLFRIYLNGKNDWEEAVKWLEKLADGGFSDRLEQAFEVLMKRIYGIILIGNNPIANPLNNLDSDLILRIAKIQEDPLENFYQARVLYQLAADKGNIEAMRCLGVVINQHFGRDYSEEEGWWLKAAQGGDAISMRLLGELNLNFYHDQQKGEEWFLKAAEAQDYEAMLSLGDFYSKFHGDMPKAENWWIKAAENGELTALERLLFYNTAEKQDYEQSLSWFEKMYEEKGANYMNNLVVSPDFLSYPIESSEKIAEFHINLTIGLELVAGLYFKENLKDYPQAEQHLKKAADFGESRAMFELAELYLNELNDPDKAEEWLEKGNKATQKA